MKWHLAHQDRTCAGGALRFRTPTGAGGWGSLSTTGRRKAALCSAAGGASSWTAPAGERGEGVGADSTPAGIEAADPATQRSMQSAGSSSMQTRRLSRHLFFVMRCDNALGRLHHGLAAASSDAVPQLLS